MLIGLMAAALAQQTAPAAPDDPCLTDLRKQWPALVSTRMEEPGITHALFAFGRPESRDESSKPTARQNEAVRMMERLDSECRGQPAALAMVRALNADQRLWIEDYAGALEVLQRAPLDPASPLVGMNGLNLLRAAAGVGDPARFATARDAVRRAHDAVTRRLGFTRVDPIETPSASVDAYHAPPGGGWVFIGWPKQGGMPMALVFRPERDSDKAKPHLDGEIFGCMTSSGVGDDALDADAPPEAVIAAARRAFSDRGQVNESSSAAIPLPPIPGGSRDAAAQEPEADPGPPSPRCTMLDHALPAFAGAPRLIGNEFAGPDAAFSEAQLTAMLDGSPEQQGKATDYILDHPDAVEPFTLLRPIQVMLARGDNLQAAFWFYVWQHRSGAWARFGAPDGAPALRGAINETLGRPINEWIGSDPTMALEVQQRALTFERHAPLYPGRPEGASAEAWADAVAKNRTLNDPAQLAALYPHDDKALQDYAAKRTGNGLYNGPLQHPGKPLREEWR